MGLKQELEKSFRNFYGKLDNKKRKKLISDEDCKYLSTKIKDFEDSLCKFADGFEKNIKNKTLSYDAKGEINKYFSQKNVEGFFKIFLEGKELEFLIYFNNEKTFPKLIDVLQYHFKEIYNYAKNPKNYKKAILAGLSVDIFTSFGDELSDVMKEIEKQGEDFYTEKDINFISKSVRYLFPDL